MNLNRIGLVTRIVLNNRLRILPKGPILCPTFLGSQLSEPLFYEPRTIRQLGYDVSCLVRNLHGMIGFSVAILSQSSRYHMKQLDDEVELFLAKMSRRISLWRSMAAFNTRVLTAVFQYIAMLQSLPPSKHIFNDIKAFEDNRFQWMEQTDPEQYEQKLASAMHLYQPGEHLTGHSLEFQEKLIRDRFDALVTKQMNVIIMSKSYQDQGKHTWLPS